MPGFERDTCLFAKVFLCSSENTNHPGVQAKEKAFIKCVYVAGGEELAGGAEVFL